MSRTKLGVRPCFRFSGQFNGEKHRANDKCPENRKQGLTPIFAQRRRRRAVSVLVVLVCITLAAAMCVVLVKNVAIGRQAAKVRALNLQADWLVESGMERAARRLAVDPNYRGETWTLSAEDFGRHDGGLIEITVRAVDGRPNERTVQVRADYPNHPQDRHRRTRRATVVTQAKTGEKS